MRKPETPITEPEITLWPDNILLERYQRAEGQLESHLISCPYCNTLRPNKQRQLCSTALGLRHRLEPLEAEVNRRASLDLPRPLHLVVLQPVPEKACGDCIYGHTIPDFGGNRDEPPEPGYVECRYPDEAHRDWQAESGEQAAALACLRYFPRQLGNCPICERPILGVHDMSCPPVPAPANRWRHHSYDREVGEPVFLCGRRQCLHTFKQKQEEEQAALRRYEQQMREEGY